MFHKLSSLGCIFLFLGNAPLRAQRTYHIHVWTDAHEYVRDFPVDHAVQDPFALGPVFATLPDNIDQRYIAYLDSNARVNPPSIARSDVLEGTDTDIERHMNLPDGTWLLFRKYRTVVPEILFRLKAGKLEGGRTDYLGSDRTELQYAKGEVNGVRKTFRNGWLETEMSFNKGVVLSLRVYDSLGVMLEEAMASAERKVWNAKGQLIRRCNLSPGSGLMRCSGATEEYYPEGGMERRGDQGVDGWSGIVEHFTPAGMVDREEYYTLGTLMCERRFDPDRGKHGKWRPWTALDPKNASVCGTVTRDRR